VSAESDGDRPRGRADRPAHPLVTQTRLAAGWAGAYGAPVETTLDSGALAVEPPIDGVAASVETTIDPIAFAVQPPGCGVMARRIGALARPVESGVDDVAAAIERLVDPITAAIEPFLDSIAAPIEAILTRYLLRKGLVSDHDSCQSSEHNSLVHISAPRVSSIVESNNAADCSYVYNPAKSVALCCMSHVACSAACVHAAGF